jgi:hypothetical protein
MEQGRTEEAIASFLRAREIFPGNAVIDANLKIAMEKRQKNAKGSI